MRHKQPPAKLLKGIRRPRRGGNPSPLDEQRISDEYRKILREYRTIASKGGLPGRRWRSAALEALRYLGGDADRLGVTLRDYDHHRYGPFLGVSDDGGAADDVCRAALASPKAQALGGRASPLTLGVALDAERLGGVGEVPVGLRRILRYLVEVRGPKLDDNQRRESGQCQALSPRSGRHHRRRRNECGTGRRQGQARRGLPPLSDDAGQETPASRSVRGVQARIGPLPHRAEDHPSEASQGRHVRPPTESASDWVQCSHRLGPEGARRCSRGPST